ncbi:MAG: hypothetical protein CM15mP68_5580 [Pseudomonadota bacterium]|nr:MAG: hypothetical protein CM15mP68_5580 [Pseudomonadota bacterium]
MRDGGDEAVFTKICENFGKNIDRHMSFWADNDQRLTGKHETQSMMSSATACLIVVHLSASRSAPSKTAGKVDWKTRTHQTPTPIK